MCAASMLYIPVLLGKNVSLSSFFCFLVPLSPSCLLFFTGFFFSVLLWKLVLLYFTSFFLLCGCIPHPHQFHLLPTWLSSLITLICYLTGPFIRYSLLVQVWDDWSFVIWCITVQEEAIRRWKCCFHYVTTNNLTCKYKAGWSHAFMLFMANSDLTIQVR